MLSPFPCLYGSPIKIWDKSAKEFMSCDRTYKQTNRFTLYVYRYSGTNKTVEKEDDVSAIIFEFDVFKRQMVLPFQGKLVSVPCIIAVVKWTI